VSTEIVPLNRSELARVDPDYEAMRTAIAVCVAFVTISGVLQIVALYIPTSSSRRTPHHEPPPPDTGNVEASQIEFVVDLSQRPG
jgi:hypothetical protein